MLDFAVKLTAEPWAVEEDDRDGAAPGGLQRPRHLGHRRGRGLLQHDATASRRRPTCGRTASITRRRDEPFVGCWRGGRDSGLAKLSSALCTQARVSWRADEFRARGSMMRADIATAVSIGAMSLLLATSGMAAPAAKLSPDEIKATFFNGQPFTASTPSNVKFKMTFTADGKMKRQPVGGGKKAARAPGNCPVTASAAPGRAPRRNASRSSAPVPTSGRCSRARAS